MTSARCQSLGFSGLAFLYSRTSLESLLYLCAITLSIVTDLERHIHLHAHDQSFFLSINCKKDDYDNNNLVILTHDEFLITFRR